MLPVQEGGSVERRVDEWRSFCFAWRRNQLPWHNSLAATNQPGLSTLRCASVPKVQSRRAGRGPFEERLQHNLPGKGLGFGVEPLG